MTDRLTDHVTTRPMTTAPPATSPMSLADAHEVGSVLVRRHADRFVALSSSLDEAELAAAVPGSSWTAGQVVTHVRTVIERYTIDLRRGATPAEVTALNLAAVDDLGVDVAAAAASIDEHLRTLEVLADHVHPAQTFPFHAGQATTFAGGWGNLLGELLAHGADVARATGRSFDIPGADLEIMWRFTAPLLQGWLRTEAAALSESWELRFTFGSIPVHLHRGVLRWDEDGPRRAEHRSIEITDAAATALQFPYRRRAITDPSLALLATRFHDI
jgi:hypothetical protein